MFISVNENMVNDNSVRLLAHWMLCPQNLLWLHHVFAITVLTIGIVGGPLSLLVVYNGRVGCSSVSWPSQERVGH